MSALAPPPERRAFPGEPGLWVFLLADMVAFGVFFAAVVVLRQDDPAAYTAFSSELDRGLGALNTVLLLCGSLAVVLGVGATRRDAPQAARAFAAAIACGLAFVVVKAVEWSTAIADGFGVSSGDLWGAYFMLTGIHLMHVVVGIGVLLVIRRRVLQRRAGRGLVDGGACYWHLVDLLWLVLFPLLYLLG